MIVTLSLILFNRGKVIYMKKNKAAGGVVLIIIGIILMLGQLSIINNINLFLIIGCTFLAVYIALGRNIGFLIPGSIITSFGLFVYLSDKKILPDNGGVLILFFIGGAFWVILFVHTMWLKTKNWGTKYWPVFPAGIITASGLITASQVYSYNNPALKLITGLIIPVVLVAAGILIMFSKRQDDSDENGSK